MIMKTQIKKIIFSIFLITLTFSCSKNEDVDSTPPGILSNISVVPTNGGGIISYSLPSDNDISYVRAEYTNSQGEEVFRVSSRYNTSLEIN
jgi:ethanolamine utilization protein EutP (predicted NTPase)